MTNSPEATGPDSRRMTTEPARRRPRRRGHPGAPHRRPHPATREPAVSDVLDRGTYRAIREPRSAARLPLGDGTWHQLARQYVWVQLISTGGLRADRARRRAAADARMGSVVGVDPGRDLPDHPGLDADHHPAPGARVRLSAAPGRPRLPARHPVAARGGGALRAHAAGRHHPRPPRPRVSASRSSSSSPRRPRRVSSSPGSSRKRRSSCATRSSTSPRPAGQVSSARRTSAARERSRVGQPRARRRTRRRRSATASGTGCIR